MVLPPWRARVLAIVVAHGDCDPPLRLHEWQARADLVFAADGGACHALALGLRPHLVIGDMDSLAPETRAELARLGASVEQHASDKDETDLELAVRAALERGASEVVILCALGGRADHLLANVMLLAAPQLEGRALLASGDTEISLVTKELALSGRPGDLLSLLPLGGDVSGIWTEGLAYPLRGETLSCGLARGVSNVFLGERATVRVASGRLLATHIRC